MNQKVEPLGGGMNTLKWIVAFTLLVAGFVAYYAFTGVLSVYVRAFGLLILSGVALFSVLQTELGKRLWVFGVAAKNEMRKVVWPSRQETAQFTAMVLLMVVVMGLILWGVDTLLLKGVALITGFRSA